MKVSQILNNNVAVVSRGTSEVIVYAKGLAFKKKVGQVIHEDEIEKTYVLDSNDMLEHFSYLLTHSDASHITLVNQIIAYGEETLGETANDYLCLTLLDHVEFALKRAAKGQFIRSPLTWEVKKFYPRQFAIGLQALRLIQKQFSFVFPEDEAVSIALHFVNLQEDKHNLDETIRSMESLRDILSIIQYHFQFKLDEASLNYMRLMTHLQYFIQRLTTQRMEEESDTALYEQIRTLYWQSFDCVQKIKVYVEQKYQCQLTSDEETYLMLHIHRVTNRSQKERT